MRPQSDLLSNSVDFEAGTAQFLKRKKSKSRLDGGLGWQDSFLSFLSFPDCAANPPVGARLAESTYELAGTDNDLQNSQHYVELVAATGGKGAVADFNIWEEGTKRCHALQQVLPHLRLLTALLELDAGVWRDLDDDVRKAGRVRLPGVTKF